MTLSSVCEECGCTFEWTYQHPSRKQRFCSRSCVAKWGHRTGKMPGRNRTGKEINCEVCGKSFYVKKHASDTRRFCSAACQHEWQARNSVVRPCEWCGKEIKMSPFRSGLQRYCSRPCYIEGLRKNVSQREYNGRRVGLTRDGYVIIWEPDYKGNAQARGYSPGWLWEHRFVMEKKLGRALTKHEAVHHINGVKDENHPDNLVVLTHGEHAKITNGEAVIRRRREREELAEYKRRFGYLT